MAASDPNLNAGWRWWEEVAGQTVYYSPNNGTPQVCWPKLPWYTPGNILNAYEIDMYPEDGWVLAYKEFGTLEQAVQFPYFALYNKYRGKFRLMLYKPYTQNSTYYMAELRFMNELVDQPQASALLTFRAQEKSFLDKFDRGQIDSSISHMDVYGSWGVFDFDFAGYDPKLDDPQVDPILQISIKGVNVGDLTGNIGGSIKLDQVLQNDSATLGASRNEFESLQEGLKAGSKYYKDVKGFQDDLKKNLEEQKKLPQDKREWWYGLATDIAPLALASFAPYAGALVGAISGFIGGGKSSPMEPMHFKGLLDLQVKMTLTDNQAALAPINLFLKPGPLSPLSQRPVQAVHWGVFNMATQPKLAEERHDESWGEWRYNARTHNLEWVKRGENYAYSVISGTMPDVVLNPNSDMHLVSKKVKFVTGSTLDQFVDFNFNSTAVIGPRSFVGVELTFKTNNPTKYADSEVKIIKSYPVEWTCTEVLDPTNTRD